MSEKRRVTSRRVVSEKVIGSANPVARWGRDSKSTCMNSIGGFFFGLLLFFVTFSLPFCAARTEKDSKDISVLKPITASEAASSSGKALIDGDLTVTSEPTPELSDITKPILAYSYERERFQTWEETREVTHTEVIDGKDVQVTEEVTEEVSDWKTEESHEYWSILSLGSVKVDPKECKIDLNWTQTYTDEYEDIHTGEKIRETESVIYKPASVRLACELENGQVVDKPDFYILTDKTQDQLVASEHKAEETNRWMLIVFSVILWAISFNLMIGPAFILLNIFPIKAIGGVARFIFGIVSLIAAALTTFITYVLVAYWWVIALLMVIVAVVVFIGASKNKQADPDLDIEQLETEDPE